MSVRALTALAIAITTTLTLAGSAPSRTLPIIKPVERHEAKIVKVTKVSKQEKAQLQRAAKQIGVLRNIAWSCQDKLIDVGLRKHRTQAGASIWALPQSVAYRTKFVAPQWIKIGKTCQKTLDLRTIPATTDWLTAVRLVQRIYPGTADWLLFISHREGGWGRFVMNTQGSGAGGWVQFMASTYYAYNDDAYADARSRGFIISEISNQWTQPLGQAITAGYMRYTHRDGCHWCL